jgi:hypothetical protein
MEVLEERWRVVTGDLLPRPIKRFVEEKRQQGL